MEIWFNDELLVGVMEYNVLQQLSINYGSRPKSGLSIFFMVGSAMFSPYIQLLELASGDGLSYFYNIKYFEQPLWGVEVCLVH